MVIANQQNTDQKPAEPPVGLFDRIIASVAEEQQQRQSKNTLLSFLAILFFSLSLLPCSLLLLLGQWKASGAQYFISLAATNLDIFLSLKQNFLLSILESLPIIPILLFSVNIALVLFSVQLFLYKKSLLLRYIMR